MFDFSVFVVFILFLLLYWLFYQKSKDILLVLLHIPTVFQVYFEVVLVISLLINKSHIFTKKPPEFYSIKEVEIIFVTLMLIFCKMLSIIIDNNYRQILINSYRYFFSACTLFQRSASPEDVMVLFRFLFMCLTFVLCCLLIFYYPLVFMTDSVKDFKEISLVLLLKSFMFYVCFCCCCCLGFVAVG